MGFETHVTNHGRDRIYDGFGGYWEKGYKTELIPLETAGSGGISTLSEGDLLPANAIIEAVTGRITTTFVGAVDWSLGDDHSPTRFCNAQEALVAGSTVVGLNHVDQGVSSPVIGAWQETAAKVAVTTSDSPEAGVIRVTVFYSRFVAPTS